MLQKIRVLLEDDAARTYWHTNSVRVVLTLVLVHLESRGETFAAVEACHRDRRLCTTLQFVLSKQLHIDVRGAIVTEERGCSRDVAAIRSRGSGRLHPFLFGLLLDASQFA